MVPMKTMATMVLILIQTQTLTIVTIGANDAIVATGQLLITIDARISTIVAIVFIGTICYPLAPMTPFVPLSPYGDPGREIAI